MRISRGRDIFWFSHKKKKWKELSFLHCLSLPLIMEKAVMFKFVTKLDICGLIENIYMLQLVSLCFDYINWTHVLESRLYSYFPPCISPNIYMEAASLWFYEHMGHGPFFYSMPPAQFWHITSAYKSLLNWIKQVGTYIAWTIRDGKSSASKLVLHIKQMPKFAIPHKHFASLPMTIPFTALAK